MVAIYTSTQKATGIQEQALAYSTDGGLTWTKYSGNPVLNINSQNFRDPKVFWYAPSHRWLMVVARSDLRQVEFYSSPDLKNWTYLSDFGPAGSITGVWECPDLFPLKVDRNPHRTKWVLVVNVNPGAPAGGSGTQYFVGQFDGTQVRAQMPARLGDSTHQEVTDLGSQQRQLIRIELAQIGRAANPMQNRSHGVQDSRSHWSTASSMVTDPPAP